MTDKGVDALYKDLEAKADALRGGKMKEDEVGAVFDQLVGTLDDDLADGEEVQIRDRNVAAELEAAVRDLGQTARKTTLRSDTDVDKAISYMTKDNDSVEDALAALDDIKL